MSLTICNTKTLIDPANFTLKVLVYALSGTGKTTWACTAPDPGFAACDTGHGGGLLSVADKNIDYCIPNSYPEFEAICGGKVFGAKKTVVLDPLNEMVNTFIKDYALTVPRSRGESPKRKMGCPEQDDYGTMGELTRRLIRKLIDCHPNQHVVVLCTERYDKPDPENGQGELLIGPNLPGQMFLGSVGMFDYVLRMKTRQVLRDPKDAKSRYSERFFITQPDGQGSIVKSRSNAAGKPLLDATEVFDPLTGQGSFPYLLDKIVSGYQSTSEVK